MHAIHIQLLKYVLENIHSLIELFRVVKIIWEILFFLLAQKYDIYVYDIILRI